MTVQELKEILQGIPDDTEVILESSWGEPEVRYCKGVIQDVCLIGREL